MWFKQLPEVHRVAAAFSYEPGVAIAPCGLTFHAEPSHITRPANNAAAVAYLAATGSELG
jgi:hypothetical protein